MRGDTLPPPPKMKIYTKLYMHEVLMFKILHKLPNVIKMQWHFRKKAFMKYSSQESWASIAEPFWLSVSINHTQKYIHSLRPYLKAQIWCYEVICGILTNSDHRPVPYALALVYPLPDQWNTTLIHFFMVLTLILKLWTLKIVKNNRQNNY